MTQNVSHPHPIGRTGEIMKPAKAFSLALCAALTTICAGTFAMAAPSAVELFAAGKVAEAKEAFADALRNAEKESQEHPSRGSERALWEQLIASAWYLDETGEHRQAIEYSNRALEIAAKQDDPFMLGRSLSWLGWAYAQVGLYETSQKFYSEALELAAPKGVPQIIPVWGLSKQELGYLAFKMGDLHTGKKFIGETTSFARDHGVLIGVAEGGVRLAEIALHEGQSGEAVRAATEARDAAEKCGCTPFTLVHAKTELAAIAVEKAMREAAQLPEAEKALKAAEDDAQKFRIKRFTAETQLLRAKLVPAHEFEKRYNLTREAFETLSTMESERRGDAEVAVGKIFLDEANVPLADFYLKHGVEVNDQMLRAVDKAYQIQDIAHVHGMRGDREQVLKKLQESADTALSSGALPAALAAEEQLFRELSQLGYTRRAAKWGKLALLHLDKLIEKESDEHSRGALQRRRLGLVEELSTETLKVLPYSSAQP